jgi:hypothetical protein
MDTCSPDPPDARQPDPNTAMAARSRERAEKTPHLDLKDGLTRLAAGYAASAKSFAKLDRYSGGND